MAFADVYPLNPPPELFIDNITVETGGFITGDVESITDVGKCAEPTPCNTGPTSVSLCTSMRIRPLALSR
jgi:hypothetical protein